VNKTNQANANRQPARES